jgi:translocation and assembly module TamB
LSGAWQLSGEGGVQGELSFGVDLAPNSRLAGASLAGAASGHWSSGRLRALDLRLAQGQDRLAAQGSLGSVGDQLKIDLQVANLERHLPGLRGPARLTGQLGGRFDDLRVGFALDAGPVDLVESQRPALRGLALKASLTGTPTVHRIDLDLSTRPERLRLSGTGGWIQAASSWQARIGGLRLDGTLPATLTEPFDLRVGPGYVELRGLELAVSEGRVRFESVDWREGTLRSAGALSGLSLAPLADWLDASQLGATTASATQGGLALSSATQSDKTTREAIARLRSLQAQGEWSIEGAAWQRLSGSASLEVKPDPAAANKALEPGLAESRLNLRLDEGRLAGEARLIVPSLAFSRRLTAPDWVADGSLAFEGRIGGSLALPELEGLLTGQSLSLANRSLGWRLRNGSLSARFDGRQLQIDSLRFASGDQGVVELLGRISPPTSARTRAETTSGSPSAAHTAGAPFDADLDLRLQRFVVPLDPGQRLLLSGRTRLVAREGSVSWSGAVKADEGLIEFRSGGAPEMPADLVIVDRRVSAPQVEKRIAPPQASPAATSPEWTPVVQADMRIELGERLRVQGGGLDARLTGELVLSGRLPQDPRVHGRVQLRDGTFAAYGRKLALSRGELRFNGEFDNPALDIVAMRNSVPVSAGVAVTGLARSPRVRLVSEPDVPDAQKLSWLVLGTGLEDAAAAGQALALREAALTLLGDDDGGMVGGLSQAFGVDAIGFGRSASGASTSLERSRLGPPGLPSASAAVYAGGAVREEVLSVSKRLNSRLTVSYERGIQGIWNLVRLQYEISNRLSLRAQSGSENAVDLLYFWWFD